ncbi:MAG: serine hydrolase [Chitinophaga sp.]|jgi:CubicO group peptidase (beta-lactamase class C family)|nr:serine hydrolase [Chitinophaga sp.]
MLRTLIFILIIFPFCSCHSQQDKTATNNLSKPNKDFQFRALSENEKLSYNNAIQPLYNKMLLQKGFNGAVLLVKNGEIVFEDYHGYINFKTKEAITAETPFHLASISKTFTGMTVLKLMEQGRLDLNDNVQKYLPEFPYNGITIKLLLTHRSGLPNYLNFIDNVSVETYQVKNKKGKIITKKRYIKRKPEITRMLTNQTLYEYLVAKHPPIQALPDRVFNYCNTNFAILALIVESITEQPFPQYMRDSVFVPLGMMNTFVFSIKDSANYVPTYRGNTPWQMDKLDAVYGDKNVYSTVRDLLAWDKALYENKFVSAFTYNLAIQPYAYERRLGHYYGLGWHLFSNPPEPTIIYHNGKWHGSNTVFKRLIHDTATVIILGNKLNANVYRAGQLSSVFTGRSDTTQLAE